jgi:NAD-dependent SIR2 family protein deacetylase
LVVLECGHEVPFSTKTIEAHGQPNRWWCSACRKSKKVIKVVEPQSK